MKHATTSGLIVVSVAALFAIIGAVSTAEAGGHGGHMSGGHMGGSAFKSGASIGTVHTNQGGKYAWSGSSGKFHTNQGGKYAWSGSSGKFHTNQGGKYAWSGKFDHHHHNHFDHGRFAWWYGLPLYSYEYGAYGGCGWLYRRAVATGSDYWWNRYYQCAGTY